MASDFFNPDVTSNNPAYRPPNIPPPPSGTSSPVTIGAFGESPTVAGAGDGVSILTPEKRLLIIINNVLEMKYDDIEEAKTKAKEAIPKMADSMLKDNFKKLIDDYEAAEDETTKKKALDTFEKSMGGNPSTSDSSTSSASTASATDATGVPISAPPFQAYPAGAMPSAIPANYSGYPGMGNQFPNIPGAGTPFNPNPSQTAGTADAATTSNTPAADSSPKQADKESVATAPAVKTNYPNYEQIPIDEDALKSDKLKSSLDGVCGNIDGEDKYSFSANKTNEEKFRQVEDDIAKAGEAKKNTENYYKEKINEQGNYLAKNYNTQRQEKIEKTYGNVYAGDPEKLNKPEGSVQTAQKSEFEKIFKTYGKPSAFEAAVNNTTNATAKAEQYVRDKEKTKEDLREEVGGADDITDLTKLQNKLNLATAVSNAVTPALASARKETQKARNELDDAKAALKKATKFNGGLGRLDYSDTEHMQTKIDEAEKKLEEAEKEEKRLEEISKYAKESELKLQGKIIETTAKRDFDIAAVANGNNTAIKDILAKKQKEADEIKPEADKILNAVKSGNLEGIEIPEGKVGKSQELKDIKQGMLLLKTKQGETLASLNELEANLKKIRDEQRYGPDGAKKSLKELAEKGETSGQTSGSNEEEKVSIDGLPDTRKKFDTLSGEFDNASSAILSAQFSPRYLGKNPITGSDYMPGDFVNHTDTGVSLIDDIDGKPNSTGLNFPGFPRGKF